MEILPATLCRTRGADISGCSPDHRPHRSAAPHSAESSWNRQHPGEPQARPAPLPSQGSEAGGGNRTKVIGTNSPSRRKPKSNLRGASKLPRAHPFLRVDQAFLKPLALGWAMAPEREAIPLPCRVHKMGWEAQLLWGIQPHIRGRLIQEGPLMGPPHTRG